MKLVPAPALAGGVLALVALTLLGAFLTSDHDLVRSLAQGLLNILIGVAGFYFGSSEGSRNKDGVIAQSSIAAQRPGGTEGPPPAA